MHQEEFIAVALGETKADLVIKNAKIVNVLTEEIYESEVAIVKGRIAGVGKGYIGEKEIDICVDGEIVRGKEFRVEVMPKAIKFVIPAK